MNSHGGARPGAGRKPTNFDHNRARKLKEQGLSYAEIADRFGISVYAVTWFFRKERNKNNQME
jgi:DNA invertase Pin-like site-specific DNA recombinase